MRAFLARKGFVRGTVSVSVACNVENGGGKVLVTVAEGAPGTVGNLRFPGATRFTPEEMARFLGAEAGKPHDFRRWEKGLSLLRSEYKREGFLTVHVSDTVERCEPSSDLLCPAVQVEEGPRYDVRWEGVAAFTAGPPRGGRRAPGRRGDLRGRPGARPAGAVGRVLPGTGLPAVRRRRHRGGAVRRPDSSHRVGRGRETGLHQGRPLLREPGIEREGPSRADDDEGPRSVPLDHELRAIPRRGLERRHERDRRVVPEVRVRPDEGPGGRRRLGRPGRDRENDPGRGGAAIPGPGNRLPGERPLPPGRIPGAHQEQEGRGVPRLRRGGGRPGGGGRALSRRRLPGCAR